MNTLKPEARNRATKAIFHNWEMAGVITFADGSREPGVTNWDLSTFKNFPFGDTLDLQMRFGLYNVLNHTQRSDVDASARFNGAAQRSRSTGDWRLSIRARYRFTDSQSGSSSDTES